jgi:hypothetical protein
VQIEALLAKKTDKNTKNNEYYEYLVKWKGRPIEEVNWMITIEIMTSWIGVHEQIVPWEFDAGESLKISI